jgi:hypothetical protein
LLLTERGRSMLRRVLQKFWQAPDRLLDWNGSLDSELDRIQTALDRIADSLDPHAQMGH